MTPPDEIQSFTIPVDAPLIEAAQRDAARALILQNARVARRFDFFSRWRSARSERILRRIGLVLCVLGAALATPLWLYRAHGWQGRWAALAAAFIVLFVVFVFLPGLRQSMLRRLDRMLVRRASRLLRPPRERGAGEMRYEIGSGMLRARWNDAVLWQHALASPLHALQGEGCIVLLRDARSQRVRSIVFTTGAQAGAMVAALARQGVTAEPITRDRLPASTVERHWP